VNDLLPQSVVEPGQKRSLTRLQDMRGFQRYPETLETRRLRLTVMILLAPPALGSLVIKPELEEMAVLDLPAVRTDVVVGLAKRPDDPDPAQAGLLPHLTQRSVRGRLTRPDASSRNLDADLLIGVIHVPEHQQPTFTDDVSNDFVLDDLVGHSKPFRARRLAVCSLPTPAARWNTFRTHAVTLTGYGPRS
jgi:hypothetical protein